MGVARQLRIHGQNRFEVRLEIFNVTNTAAFNLPGSLNFNDARNFASITGMRNTPRQVQLGAKLYW
jgi:hypothetical protein